MGHRYDPDAEDAACGIACAFPESVISAFIGGVLPRLHPSRRPSARDRATVRAWLEAAAASAARKPEAESRRRDGRQVWRTSRPFDRIYLVVSVEPDGATCVGINRHAGASTRG